MKPKNTALGPFLLALVVVCGCKKDKPAPPTPELDVTLIESGQSPRHPLRYAIAPNTVVQSILEVRTTDVTSEDVQEVFGTLPGLRIELHAGPTVSLSDALTRYVLRISRAYPILPEDVEVEHVQDVEGSVLALNDTRGRFDLNDRGVVMESDVPWTQGQERINPRVTIMLGNVRSAIATVPFPAEAVGVGAVWEVRRQIRIWSARVTQVTRYELVDHGGDRLRVRIIVRQSAPAQVADLNPKLEMHVKVYEMQAEGHALVDLSLPVVLEADLESTSQAELALVSPEQTEPILSSRRTVLRLSTESER
jgi:hypothetical protein